MRTTWFVAFVLSLLGGVSCREQAPTAGEVLVVLPSATDVERATNTVKYRVNDTYPATETTKALVDALTAKSCVLLPHDPFNPPPGFKSGAWEEVKAKDGSMAQIWIGGWQCKGGVVVTFSLLSKHEGDTIGIVGGFYPDEQVKQLRKITHTVTYGERPAR